MLDKEKPKTKRISISVNDVQLSWCHKIAREAGYRSLSAFVIDLIKKEAKN